MAMGSLSFLLLCCLVNLLSFCHSVPSNETDRMALLAFKDKITNDPLKVLSTWNDSIHFCQWTGVSCGQKHQRVTVLNLASLELAGSISPYIGNLSFLRELSLENNNISSQIPPQLGYLLKLQNLALKNNSLVGEIPVNLSRCLSLTQLHLGHNHLSGEIPPELGSLVRVKILYANDNNLTGNIPSSFGNLSSLAQLSLAGNYLNGVIPDTLGRLKNLNFVALNENELQGPIPPSIFKMSTMDTFDVGLNQIHGTLPSDLFFNLPNLVFFSIAYNNFTGSIPESLSNSSSLERLFVSSNHLTGKVPNLERLQQLQVFVISTNSLGFGQQDDLSFVSSLANATSLQVLQFGSNSFGGEWPETISNWSKLFFLAADGNQIVGTVPNGIGDLVNLELLSLSFNQFSGSIPNGIGNLKKLKMLGLDNNELVGNIPSSVGNLDQLIQFDSYSNKLQGSIPTSFENCKSLLALDISDNNISGVIPSQIFKILSLTIGLNLSHNRLTGTLPTEVGDLDKLGVLDISGNKITGELPTSLANCKSLEELSIRDNFFHGIIPSSLSSLTGLHYLDVSNNNLSGEIPIFLGAMDKLNYVNLSFNSLVGKLPEEGVFKNASATFVEGNTRLCGGVPEFHLSKCRDIGAEKVKRLSHKLKIVISVLFAVLGTVLVMISLLFWFKRRKSKTASDNVENSLLQLSYQDLFRATDGFSPSNLIGIGGFGSVYKATLNSGQVVAVKVFNLQRQGAFKSFLIECEAMKKMRHRNLVKVITACSSIDMHGDDFKALVYEFMINGSLEEWLHPNSSTGSDDTVLDQRKLTFLQRLNIAIDVACGLDYLHHQYSQTPIVHCDLKPSNVLLDGEMTAQVGDFGLVKFVSNNSSADPSSSVGVRGTVGYVAPEYGMGTMVSTHGDVYSYGVLLLEMFTGKKPTDDMFNDNLNLHKYVKSAMPDQVAEIAEPILLEESDLEEESDGRGERKQTIIESLALIYEIGVGCSEESPRERKGINEVVPKLIAIRDNLNNNGANGRRGQAPPST